MISDEINELKELINKAVKEWKDADIEADYAQRLTNFTYSTYSAALMAQQASREAYDKADQKQAYVDKLNRQLNDMIDKTAL